MPDNLDGKSVVAIRERAFSQNEYIKEVILPDSIVPIEEAAFKACENLTKVTLGQNTETIGLGAFY